MFFFFMKVTKNHQAVNCNICKHFLLKGVKCLGLDQEPLKDVSALFDIMTNPLKNGI